jgi:hypothetical protein
MMHPLFFMNLYHSSEQKLWTKTMFSALSDPFRLLHFSVLVTDSIFFFVDALFSPEAWRGEYCEYRTSFCFLSG